MKTSAGDIPRLHTIEECPQGSTIAQLQRSTDRVAVALESIAAQGVAVEQHEKRLDKNDREHDEIFPRLRAVERAVDIKEKFQGRQRQKIVSGMRPKYKYWFIGGRY
jgi:hypothetical protein